jgi:flagellar biosynthesis/type III secretory pathway protein FliH
MWDKEETQKLMQLGLTFEQAKIVVGRIAEHREDVAAQSYVKGIKEGFDMGWKEGYDKGHERGYDEGRSKECFFTG